MNSVSAQYFDKFGQFITVIWISQPTKRSDHASPPDWLDDNWKKNIPVKGDSSELCLSLSPDDRKLLIEEVTVVFFFFEAANCY